MGARARAPLYHHVTPLHVHQLLLANQKCDKFRGDSGWLATADSFVSYLLYNSYKASPTKSIYPSNQITFYRRGDADEEKEEEACCSWRERHCSVRVLMILVFSRASLTRPVHFLDNVRINMSSNPTSPVRFVRLLSPYHRSFKFA